jgi:hypothetical protein
MPNHPCIQLKALPDFSVFQFAAGKVGAVIIQLSFTTLKPGLYDLGIRHWYSVAVIDPSLFTVRHVEDVLFKVIGIIELYTEKYPDRVIRLGGSNRLQSMLFRIIMRSHQETLHPLFIIDEPGRKPFFRFRRQVDEDAFLLRRKSAGSPLSHPVRTTLITRSRLFGSPMNVELQKDIPVCW